MPSSICEERRPVSDYTNVQFVQDSHGDWIHQALIISKILVNSLQQLSAPLAKMDSKGPVCAAWLNEQ